MVDDKKIKEIFKEKKYSCVQVPRSTYATLGDACEKVSDMVGFRVSKSELLSLLVTHHLGAVVKRYEAACARLRAEKLL